MGDIGKTATSKYNWGKEVVCSLHIYLYETWKLQNEIVHRKSKKSQKHLKQIQLQERVADLYQKGRANLSLKEKSYFKLPLEQQQKRDINLLSLWIQIVECIFKNKGAARQETIDNWLTQSNHTLADHLRRPKGKHKYNTENTNQGSQSLDDGGVEESRS